MWCSCRSGSGRRRSSRSTPATRRRTPGVSASAAAEVLHLLRDAVLGSAADVFLFVTLRDDLVKQLAIQRATVGASCKAARILWLYCFTTTGVLAVTETTVRQRERKRRAGQPDKLEILPRQRRERVCVRENETEKQREEQKNKQTDPKTESNTFALYTRSLFTLRPQLTPLRELHIYMRTRASVLGWRASGGSCIPNIFSTSVLGSPAYITLFSPVPPNPSAPPKPLVPPKVPCTISKKNSNSVKMSSITAQKICCGVNTRPMLTRALSAWQGFGG